MVNGLLYLVKVVSCKKCLVIGMNPSVSGKGLKSMLFMLGLGMYGKLLLLLLSLL